MNSYQKANILKRPFLQIAKLLIRLHILLIIIGPNTKLLGQSVADERDKFVIFKVNGGVYVPGGDLADRFGVCGMVGLGIGAKTASNWIIDANWDFIFGSDVKEKDPISSLLTENGFLIGTDGFLYDPILYQRGYRVHAGAGKIFSIKSWNTNSGFFIKGNIGLLQHKIYYQIPGDEIIPQLNKEARKGYDLLTNGLSLTQFIGIIVFSKNRFANFKAGLEFTQAFTQNRREVNFNSMSKDDQQRLDLLFGLRFSWILPFYK